MKPKSIQQEEDAETGRKALFTGIAVNLVLSIIKGIAGVLGHSYALTADAIESGADVFTSLVVWLGIKVAGKAPDQNHPYGHGKAEPLAAIAVGCFMALAAVFISVESVRNILIPHKIPHAFTLLVLAGAIAVKELLFRFVVRAGERMQSSAVKAEAQHQRSDVITSVAAFAGISVGLIGGPGYESADDWAALLAAGVILYNSYKIIRPALGEIMDEAPGRETEFMVRNIAALVPGVSGLEKCFVRKMGFHYFVDLHVLVNGTLTVTEGHQIAHEVKAAVMQANHHIADVLVHIEPD